MKALKFDSEKQGFPQVLRTWWGVLKFDARGGLSQNMEGSMGGA